VPVYDAERLAPGQAIVGPALVDDPTTTVLVLEGFECTVDAQRNLVLRATTGTADTGRRQAAGVVRADK